MATPTKQRSSAVGRYALWGVSGLGEFRARGRWHKDPARTIHRTQARGPGGTGSRFPQCRKSPQRTRKSRRYSLCQRLFRWRWLRGCKSCRQSHPIHTGRNSPGQPTNCSKRCLELPDLTKMWGWKDCQRQSRPKNGVVASDVRTFTPSSAARVTVAVAWADFGRWSSSRGSPRLLAPDMSKSKR